MRYMFDVVSGFMWISITHLKRNMLLENEFFVNTRETVDTESVTREPAILEYEEAYQQTRFSRIRL